VEKVTPTPGPHVSRAGVIQYATEGSCRGAMPAFAAILLWSLLTVQGLHSQQSKPSEYQVKATYLYNFGRFVKWPAGLPAGKGDSFPVCVLGRDPFGPILDSTLAGEALEGKPVAIRRIAREQDAADCRILFVSSTEEHHLKEILAAIDQAGILTVSDIPGFSRRGGMIQFVMEGDRVRFEINLATAESARLVLSSELLKVAAAVRRNARSGD
jgi:YfiR/HmsC-like